MNDTTTTEVAPDSGEHMALASGSAIAANPALSIASQVTSPASDDYVPPTNDDSALAALKAADMPEQTLGDIRAWVERGVTQTSEELAQIDAADRTASEGELRGLWGDKYADNVQAISQYLDTRLAPGMGDVLKHARKPDGRAFANDPATLQRLLGLALKPRPESGRSVDAEIKNIEAFMRSDRAAYTKDEPMQARYRELLALKQP